jgi:tripartite-type tricarboxylate transporter receptor subunit TctC
VPKLREVIVMMENLLRKDNQAVDSLESVVRFFLIVLLIISLHISILPTNSEARDWPIKTISIIVPWAAGAATDLTARILSTKMSQMLNVPILVVGKPGGSGIIGTLEAVRSAPDGYTLLMDCNGTSSIQYAWSENLPYKIEDRTYIARAIISLEALLVPGSSPLKTLEDLVKAIRTNPSNFSFGNIGGTGVPDAALAQFQAALIAGGVDLSKVRMVTYKGSGESITAVAGGHVTACFAGLAGTQALMSAGKIRALAVTSAERYKPWPTVPTMIELGFPSVNMLYWAGLSGPPGLPASTIKILDDAVKVALQDPDVIDKLAKIGIEPAYQPSDIYRKFVFDEGIAIKSLKIK